MNYFISFEEYLKDYKIILDLYIRCVSPAFPITDREF